MARFSILKYLGRKLKIKLMDELLSSIILIISILFVLVYLEEFISLAIFIPGYIVLVLLIKLSVKRFYSKKIFLVVYRVAVYPITAPLLLLIILGINFFSTLTVLANLTLIFSLTLFISFVSHFWLNSLRKGKYSFQTVQIYRHAPKSVKWFFLSLLTAPFVIPILGIFRPILSTMTYLFLVMYFGFLYIYILVSLIANIRFISLSENDSRKYCEMGLIEIEKGMELFRKGEYRDKEKFIKKHLPVFPVVVNLFNELAGRYYPDLLPNIPNSDLYIKALFASAVNDEPRLKEPLEGIRLMTKALKLGKSRKPIDFTSFIEGLCVVAGKMEFSNIPEAFEIQPRLRESLSRNKGIAIALTLTIGFGIFAIILTVRLSAPEVGYGWTKETLGEDVAKWIFPIGEASIETQYGLVELSLSSWGDDRLEGICYGEYSFNIKNEHRRNILIENVIISGPELITGVESVPDTIKDFLEVETIKNSKIESPTDRVIDKETVEKVTITFKVEHDLRALREYLEENHLDDYLIVYGEGVHMSVLYRIMGTDLRENISKKFGFFNFFFESKFFK